MNIFDLRDGVLADYQEYVEGFLNIKDPRIREFVTSELSSGAFWPDALIQINPSFEMGPTVAELVDQGLLHPLCKTIFQKKGSSFRLFDHQARAVNLALQKKHYVLTTGTGSGKSLTYIIPIMNHILQNGPEPEQVRALIVYPMNALINSQENSIAELLSNLGSNNDVIRFARYTGQEDAATREKLQQHPPHILLTNYMMLELMMSRPQEHVFLDKTLAKLEFLVLDELHTYTGRQGADVSMLVRRVRRRCGNPNLQCIGTSATMVAGGAIEEQRAKVAETAAKIFGVQIGPDQVVDETLKRSVAPSNPMTQDALRRAVSTPTPTSYDEFVASPLAAWIEDAFGIQTEGDFFRRQTPIDLDAGAQKLADQTGIDKAACAQALREMFQAGSQLRHPDGTPVLAIRLHQFISKCESVYASVEPPHIRHLTLSGQRFVKTDGGREVLLAPILFCRECGQEYYRVSLNKNEGLVVPRLPRDFNDEEDESVDGGYLLVEGEDPIWVGNPSDLPDTWFTETKAGPKLKNEFVAFEPRPVYVSPGGQYSEKWEQGHSQAWFLRTPLLTCLSCGTVYDKRTGEFRKLAALSSEGRSTATTILCSSVVTKMQREELVPKEAQKILSFTDNRQDASLQAGHFNDFVFTGILRSAIYKALPDGSHLEHSSIAEKTAEATGLIPQDYAKNPGMLGVQPKKNREALIAFIEYCIYSDLRRGWRLVQPNLEQCGLLTMQYDILDEVCAKDDYWEHIPVASECDAPTRLRVCLAVLNHLRYSLAIDAEPLQGDKHIGLRKKVNATLKDPWCFDDDELLKESTWFVFGKKPEKGEMSLGVTSALGKYLRSSRAWPTANGGLNANEYQAFLSPFVSLLNQAGYVEHESMGEAFRIRLHCNSMHWLKGSGIVTDYDPVRSKKMPKADVSGHQHNINQFFHNFYKQGAEGLARLEGREHTGQTSKEDRAIRENRFKAGELSCLFCSPTMELGIDIADLNSVNMRNVPPSPANYAQRSGRAGRSGQPALISTYCSTGSGHDQYFFRRPKEMVSGVVAPPRLDLSNEELVRAHVNAVWLSHVGLDLGSCINELLDLSEKDYPLKESVKHQVALPAAKVDAVLKDCEVILAQCKDDLNEAVWFDAKWLESTLNGAPKRFDDAFDRWRELFRTAQIRLEECQKVIGHGPAKGLSKETIKKAEYQATEAKTQREILCNQGSRDSESEFYPYRYLAAEGFLPGYNFPRLPVRAYFPREKQKGTFLSRGRFLALTEYGPRNVIYHEGRKYRVVRMPLPPAEEKFNFVKAKLCRCCGYFYTDLELDVCTHCSAELHGDNCDIVTKLLEMSTVYAQRTERISCDEEERIRQGYETSSHFRFAKVDGKDSLQSAEVWDEDGSPILRLLYGPSAELWRINRKWRRGKENGFTISLPSGYWNKKPGEADDAADAGNENVQSGVQILVKDTRNILLVKGTIQADLKEDTLTNLQHALQKAMSLFFQVDEDEIDSERIGRKSDRSILFWEAAEGGVGILQRLITDPATMSQVARAALEICHFDPDSGKNSREETECSRACYECLLSYRNQWDHGALDRNAIKELLVRLSHSTTKASYGSRTYEEQYQWLRTLTDPKSTLETKFLDHLYHSKRKLPDQAQKFIDYPSCNADFFYEDNYVCVFCDGSVHDAPDQKAKDAELRHALTNGGYHVVVIRYDKDMSEQIKKHESVFGGAGK